MCVHTDTGILYCYFFSEIIHSVQQQIWKSNDSVPWVKSNKTRSFLKNLKQIHFKSISSATQSCPTLCNSMDCSTPGFPVSHFPKFAQVYSLNQWCWPPSHPLSHSSAFNLSQHQGLFQWDSCFASGGQRIGASASASVLPMSIQGWFLLRLTGLISCCLKDSQESSPAPQFESISSLAVSLLYGPTLTSIHDYWENHSFDYMDVCQQSDVSAF